MKRFDFIDVLLWVVYVAVLFGWGVADGIRVADGQPIAVLHLPAFIWKYILAFVFIITSWGWRRPTVGWRPVGDFIIYAAGGMMATNVGFNVGHPLIGWDYVGVTFFLDRFFHLFDPHAFMAQCIFVITALILGVYLKVKL